MAHTKSAGAGKYGRDSQPKYLGVKKYDNMPAEAGDILIRQRGTKFVPGEGTRRGGDDTLYAIRQGVVKFRTIRKERFDGTWRHAKQVSVVAVGT
ncbi:MAG: 50S ribosomal protein L27 [Candidatus Sungbacteria bacterium RIFCSPLOWO2_01_FULL_54_21]|uniref:Large ribosomal subunit protein bL27 n=2 Tax=Candidatus Sungiibacteriota TaxID=1817917 RepID=A0A1G2L9C9_9BACT|nr:MAG: 50S ribosomal protein L27 [Candidatus Sungbacteria bacterium RIFCSPHIGHO2_02_FULL_53_17]OHA07379.1 MAG: 50S ribosomal protein L27 [Candidatus Sungbacteria bacterium RIFCSPLOWO2_01_FULL_54_21]